MANKYRGEVDIVLNGKPFTLRPTFEALVEFEDRSGVTAYEALRDFADKQRFPAKVIAAALVAGIRAGYPTDPIMKMPSPQEIGRMVQAHGVMECVKMVFQFLNNALSSDMQIETAGKTETGT